MPLLLRDIDLELSLSLSLPSPPLPRDARHSWGFLYYTTIVLVAAGPMYAFDGIVNKDIRLRGFALGTCVYGSDATMHLCSAVVMGGCRPLPIGGISSAM